MSFSLLFLLLLHMLIGSRVHASIHFVKQAFEAAELAARSTQRLDSGKLMKIADTLDDSDAAVRYVECARA